MDDYLPDLDFEALECPVCSDIPEGECFIGIGTKAYEARPYCFSCDVIVLHQDDWIDEELIDEVHLVN